MDRKRRRMLEEIEPLLDRAPPVDEAAFGEAVAATEARADSPMAQPAAAVEKLADALFRDFPGESGRTIRVE